MGLVVPRFLNQSKMILLAAAEPSVTSTIENGFVHQPDKAAWLDEYVHELAGFPKGKYDDQADSTSQALDWFKQSSMESQFGVLDLLKDEIQRLKSRSSVVSDERFSYPDPWRRQSGGGSFPFGRF